MVEKQGVGSIWNKGNWHWEERNYKDFAIDWLTKQWTSIVETTADARISIYEVKTLTGSASVTIRKQKQIFMYEFEAELYFRAVHLTDDRQDVMGRIKIHEFNQEDDELQVELNCEKSTPWADTVKSFMRNKMPEILQKHASKLIQAMKEKDIDDARLAEAKARSKQAEEDYKKVNEETAEQKLQIAAERKKKEEEMKAAEALKSAQQPTQIQAAKKIEGTGSVWNTNSYHWEEKSVSKWSEDQMRQIISGFKHSWNDAHLIVKEIKSFKGESSVSIRKGKKIVAYDYAITLSWQVDMNDKDGKSIATCTGTYEMPEISNEESMDSWEVRVQYESDSQNLKACLDQFIKGFATKALKETIQKEFVEELQKK